MKSYTMFFIVASLFVGNCFILKAQNRSYYMNFRTTDQSNEFTTFCEIEDSLSIQEKATYLDSLASYSFAKGNYVDYLFYKNIMVNRYRSARKYKEAVACAINAKNLFAQHADTIHLEYYMIYMHLCLINEAFYKEYNLSYYEVMKRKYDIARLLDHSKYQTHKNPYYMALIHMIQLHTKYYNLKELFHYLELLRNEIEKYNNYSGRAYADNIISREYDNDLKETATLLNRLNFRELSKEGKDYKDAAGILTMKIAANIEAEYQLNKQNYTKAEQILEKADSLFDNSYLAHKLKRQIYLLRCYKENNETIKYDSLLKEFITLFNSPELYTENKIITIISFYVYLGKWELQLCSDLVDPIIQNYPNNVEHIKAVWIKLYCYNDAKDYKSAVELAEKYLIKDNISGLFNLDQLSDDNKIDMNMFLASLYFNHYKQTEKANLLEQFEIYAIRAIQLFKSYIKANVLSHETNNLQSEFKKFITSYLILPYIEGYSFSNIEMDLIASLFSLSKSQSTNNGVARLAEISKLESSKYTNEYYNNLRNIQIAKNQLQDIPDSTLNPDKIKVLSDLLFENAYLRYKIRKEEHFKIDTTFPNLLSLSQIQGKLTNNQTIIEFLEIDSLMFANLITKDTSLTYNYPQIEVSNRVNDLLRAIKTGSENLEVSTKLGKLLFTEMAEILNVTKELIIIPDGVLFKIPFEYLSYEGSSNEPLINKHVINYNYSTLIWYYNYRANESAFSPSVLTMAPVFDNIEKKDSLFIADAFRGKINLTALPYSFQEVKQINKLFRKYNLDHYSLTFENATKPNFYNNYKNYSIVHFATHGMSNTFNFERSGLYMYQTDSSSNKAENFLSLGEIYALQNQPDLVVLSACKTGTGKIIDGEGVMALPRGFIYAGVPNVIASLWKVHDEKTKDLMVAFYKHLLEDNVSYAEALRLAKLDCIEKGFLPVDWAGFVLIGN